jgi:hypothetical protein
MVQTLAIIIIITVIHLIDSSIFSAIDDNSFWVDDNTVGFLSTRSGYCQLWVATIPNDPSKLAEQNGLSHTSSYRIGPVIS